MIKTKLENLTKEQKHHINSVTRQVLKELGAPIGTIGYTNTMCAVLILVTNYGNQIPMTTPDGVYHTIAGAFDTTPPRVERSIRHLSEVIVNKGEYTLMNRIFGSLISKDSGLITNSNFLYALRDEVMERLGYDF